MPNPLRILPRVMHRDNLQKPPQRNYFHSIVDWMQRVHAVNHELLRARLSGRGWRKRENGDRSHEQRSIVKDDSTLRRNDLSDHPAEGYLREAVFYAVCCSSTSNIFQNVTFMITMLLEKYKLTTVTTRKPNFENISGVAHILGLNAEFFLARGFRSTKNSFWFGGNEFLLFEIGGFR
jgi:hypothetical protein